MLWVVVEEERMEMAEREVTLYEGPHRSEREIRE
jgi:hypothetical protein